MFSPLHACLQKCAAPFNFEGLTALPAPQAAVPTGPRAVLLQHLQMIHNPTLQMFVRSSASQSCRSIFRSHDLNKNVAAHHARPLNSSNIPVYSVSQSHENQCCIATTAAPRCCTVENAQDLRRSDKNCKPLSFLHSVSSLPCRSKGNDALQLESFFVPRFRNGGDSSLYSGRSSFRGYCTRPLEVHNWRASSVQSSERSFGSFSGGFGKERNDGLSDGVRRRQLLSSKFESSHARRVVLARSSAAATSSLPSPSQPQNFWYTVWVNLVAFWVGTANKLQSIRIGWLDLLTMLRIVLITAGAFAAYVASKRAWAKIQAMASDGEGEAGAEGEGGGPMQLLARGATCVQSSMGPWSLADMTLGLSAIAKVTEKEPPPLPGQEVKDLSNNPNFLLRAQHWRVVSEAVYVKDSASFSLFTGLPESSLVACSWEPTQDTFRPAYAVFVDAPYGAVVLAVRGTSHIIDMLLNSGASPEPFGEEGSYAHGGYVHAAKTLHEEVLPHIEKAFREHGGSQKDLKLIVAGHSMGAAVGSLISLKLREKWPDLQMWGYCPPACMSLDLAKECKSFTTSFVAAYDVVPRFSLHAVEKLRTKIQEFDYDEVERVAKDDEDWQNIKKAMSTFKGLQQKQKEAIEKLTGGDGAEDSETAQKAKEIGKKVVESETANQVAGFAQGIGLQAQDMINGTDSKKDQAEDCESTEDGEVCNPPALHPPGRLLVLGSDPPGCGKMPESRSGMASERSYGTYPTFDERKNYTWRMVEASQEDLEEIIVSPWCMSDHMLGNLCEAIGYLQSTCPPAIKPTD